MTFTSLAYGEGMDQTTMMESDYLIPVDKHDNPLLRTSESESSSSPSQISNTIRISKRQAHEFNPTQPRGIAHRAFSVFLFNSKNELLLTQRASSKITFPNVWTNTCCSHPLTDMIPNEVDTNHNYPQFPGVKHAAIRKLKHELGIEHVDVPFEDFQFVTRFHYWAADTVTYGKDDAPWGEHEIDYILFIKCSSNDSDCNSACNNIGRGEPTLRINEEEVSDYEYVSVDRLKECMYDKTKTLRKDKGEMLFSPWFRGIMEHGGFDWMEDLDGVFEGKYTDDRIYYFDPPKEHYAVYNLDSHTREVGVLDESSLESAPSKTETSSRKGEVVMN